MANRSGAQAGLGFGIAGGANQIGQALMDILGRREDRSREATRSAEERAEKEYTRERDARLFQLREGADRRATTADDRLAASQETAASDRELGLVAGADSSEQAGAFSRAFRERSPDRYPLRMDQNVGTPMGPVPTFSDALADVAGTVQDPTDEPNLMSLRGFEFDPDPAANDPRRRAALSTEGLISAAGRRPQAAADTTAEPVFTSGQALSMLGRQYPATVPKPGYGGGNIPNPDALDMNQSAYAARVLGSVGSIPSDSIPPILGVNPERAAEGMAMLREAGLEGEAAVTALISSGLNRRQARGLVYGR